MAWYTTGTVTATNASGTITGAGTAFLTNVRVGDGVTITGSTSVHEVTNIASDTQLTVSPVYGGTTGGSKTYGIVPVQGYVKDLADQVKSLILTFNTVGGSASVLALAGVAGAVDKVPYFTSGTAMSTMTVTATARTLLDDTTISAMRTTLGLKTAALGDILGTVSQAGGVPTGAIYQYGSNANGSYIRFADGTQICTIGSGLVPTATGVAGFAWTFPIAFITAPTYTNAFSQISNGQDPRNYTSQLVYGFQTANYANFTTYSISITGWGCVAIGRWF